MNRPQLVLRILLAVACLGMLEAVLIYRLQYVQHYPLILFEVLNMGLTYALGIGVPLAVAALGLRALRSSPSFLSAGAVVVVPVFLLFRYQKYVSTLDPTTPNLGWPGRLLALLAVVVGTLGLGFLFRRFPALEPRFHAAVWGVTGAVLVWTATSPMELDPSGFEIRSGPDHPVNVVWVTADALRADHLSVHGYGRETSPFLARFLDDAVFFERNYSQCCWTQPAMISLFTALYPFESFQMEGSLSPDLVTVSQVLKAAGYSTIGLSNNEVVGPSTNLDRGFDVFHRPPRLYANDRIIDYSTLVYVLDDFARPWADSFVRATTFVPQRRRELPERTERALFDRALPYLEEAEKPFFLYMHFMAPHAPYAAEAPWDEWGDASLPGTEHLLHGAREMPPKEIPGEELDDIVWRYDREIRMVDDYLERLTNRLKELGLYDDCLFIFTSDHGEEFLEHGEWTHGRGLYQESVHVPLIVKLPANRHGGTTIERPTQGVDVLPTLLEILGIEMALPYDLRGDALFTRNGEGVTEVGERPIVIEFNSHYPNIGDQTAIVLENFKLVHFVESNEYELYDLEADPLERSDLATVNPEKLEELRQILTAIIQDHHGDFYGEAPSPLEAQRIREELRALGYIK